MYKYFILRDTRLGGNLPIFPAMLITAQVDQSTPLANAFSRIKSAYLSHGKMRTLFILCHGYQDALGPFRFGGRGLALGKEDLYHINVAQWAAIRDMFESIVVYACGAAFDGVAGGMNANDGRGLMLALAKYTNAVVYAGEKTQRYFPDEFNFGKWEGQVYMFFPSGFAMPVSRPPTEVIDVISPIPDGPGMLGKQMSEILRNVRRDQE